MFPAERVSVNNVLDVALHTWIAFFCSGIQVVIILKGVEGIKYLETWSAPFCSAADWYCSSGLHGAPAVWYVLTISALQKQHGEFWHIFPGALTASVGYWATLSLNIPDFTRYARSQKSQMLGQAGTALTMTLRSSASP